MVVTERSRGWRILAAVAIVLHLAVIFVVLPVDSLHIASKLGVVVLFGSNIPRLSATWVPYSLAAMKRLLILRFVGLAAGLILLTLGALGD
jgi:hypothetical protein